MAVLDHSENDCVGMAIMSHGDLDRDGDDIVYGSDGETVKLISLLEPLSDRTDLHRKPKLIFVQVALILHINYFSCDVNNSEHLVEY